MYSPFIISHISLVIKPALFFLKAKLSKYETKIFIGLLAAVIVGCVIWAAAAPRMLALIPTFIAVCAGIALAQIKEKSRKN